MAFVLSCSFDRNSYADPDFAFSGRDSSGVTGSALAAALTPAGLGLNQMTFVLTLLTGWLLAILLSPFSATSLLAGAYTGKASWDISLKMNGLFGLFCLVFFSILLSVIGPLL